MKTRALRSGIIMLALFFAAALPFAANAGTLKITEPAEGATVHSDIAKLFIVSDFNYSETSVDVFLNGEQVQGFTPPIGMVTGLKKGDNTIKVAAGGKEASVTFKSAQ